MGVKDSNTTIVISIHIQKQKKIIHTVKIIITRVSQFGHQIHHIKEIAYLINFNQVIYTVPFLLSQTTIGNL